MSETKQPQIVDTSDETFELDVVERSRVVPVVVDFWAEWCGPCRMLGPILEQLAAEYKGQFVLAKANTDACPRVATEFSVQSIPAVFAVLDGEVVDYFVGVLPPEQIRNWLERLLQGQRLQQARTLESSDPSAAEAAYRSLLEKSPDLPQASIGLARLAVAAGELHAAREILEKLERRGFLEPEAESVKAALEIGGATDTDLEAIRGQAEAAPEDLALQLKLAHAYAATKNYEAALQTAIQIVERQRDGIGDEARQLMVDIFLVLPADSPLTMEYRRKLSMALY